MIQGPGSTSAARVALDPMADPVSVVGSSARSGVRCTPGARRRLMTLLEAREGAPQAVWVRREDSGGFALVLVDRTASTGPEWQRSVEAPESAGIPDIVWRVEDAAELTAALIDHRDGGFAVRTAVGDEEAFAGDVRRVLEDGVNPLVASHGGRILLVDAADGVARVRMEGGCQGCTAARETLAGVVSRHLLHAVPGLLEVIDVTDHEAGETPWYAPAREGVISLPVLPQGLREACR